MIARLKEIAKRRRLREAGPKPATVAVACAVYFFGGLGVMAVDAKFLLTSWLFAGALGLAIWFARENEESVFNAYTVFFSVGLIAGLAGFAVKHGWFA